MWRARRAHRLSSLRGGRHELTEFLGEAARQNGSLPTPRSKVLGDVVLRRQVKPQAVLLIASLGTFMAFLDATIVTIAMPDIVRSFPHAGINGLSWVLNAYNIVFAAFLVAAGRAADLLGRKRMSEFGLLTFTTASAACALAPSAELLIAARIVQGIGAAIIVPASLALVMHAFPARERPRAVALWAATAALAAGLGPSAGGVLVYAAGWRAAFLVNIPIGVAAIVLARRTLVESRAPGMRMLPDLGGAMLLAGAVGALVLSVVKGPDWGWDNGRVIGAAILAVALATLFVRRSARHPAPLLDGALLRIRSLSVANGLMTLAAAAYFGVILNNVLFLTTVWRWSILQAGLAMTPGPIVAAIVAGPVGRLMGRIDARLLIFVGGAIWAAGIACYLLLVGATPDYLGAWLPATIVAGTGAGISFPTISGVAVAAAPGERFATATAITGVARQIGAAIGVAVLIAVIGTPATMLKDFQRGWVLAIGIFLALALCALALGKVPRDEADDAEAVPGASDPSLYGDAREIVSRSGAGSRERRMLPGFESSRSIAGFLSAVPMLAGAQPDELERLAATAAELRVRGGDVIFYDGEKGDCLFVVVTGRLEVVVMRDGAEELMTVLYPGDVVGELAVLASEPRSATVRARRDTRLIQLGGEDFRALLTATPDLALSVTGALARQVRDSRPAVPLDDSLPVTLAVVPLTAETAAVAPRFAHDLREALARHGRAALITGPIASDVGTPLELVDAHERDNDHVVLLAGCRPAAMPGLSCVCATPTVCSPSRLVDRYPIGSSGTRSCAPATSCSSIEVTGWVCTSGRKRWFPNAASESKMAQAGPRASKLPRAGSGDARPAWCSRAGGRGASRTSACSRNSWRLGSRSTASAASAAVRGSARCSRSAWTRTRSTPAATRTGSAATP